MSQITGMFVGHRYLHLCTFMVLYINQMLEGAVTHMLQT